MFNTCTNKMEKNTTLTTVLKSNRKMEIHNTRIYVYSLPWVCTAINRNWKKNTSLYLFVIIIPEQYGILIKLFEMRHINDTNVNKIILVTF